MVGLEVTPPKKTVNHENYIKNFCDLPFFSWVVMLLSHPLFFIFQIYSKKSIKIKKKKSKNQLSLP